MFAESYHPIVIFGSIHDYWILIKGTILNGHIALVLIRFEMLGQLRSIQLRSQRCVILFKHTSIIEFICYISFFCLIWVSMVYGKAQENYVLKMITICPNRFKDHFFHIKFGIISHCFLLLNIWIFYCHRRHWYFIIGHAAI